MSTLPSETAWLCLAVTAALGGLVLCQLKKSLGQVGRKVVCLAGLWGGACLLSLSLFWGLILFSLSCFLLYIYLSGQELLPVDQKAVLITGKLTTLQFSPRAGSGTCFVSAGLFQICFKNKMLGCRVNESTPPSSSLQEVYLGGWEGEVYLSHDFINFPG